MAGVKLAAILVLSCFVQGSLCQANNTTTINPTSVEATPVTGIITASGAGGAASTAGGGTASAASGGAAAITSAATPAASSVTCHSCSGSSCNTTSGLNTTCTGAFCWSYFDDTTFVRGCDKSATYFSTDTCTDSTQWNLAGLKCASCCKTTTCNNELLSTQCDKLKNSAGRLDTLPLLYSVVALLVSMMLNH